MCFGFELLVKSDVDVFGDVFVDVLGYWLVIVWLIII